MAYDAAAVTRWIENLIEHGTGLSITAEGPLHPHEARRISWEKGEATITALERERPEDEPPLHLLRFGFLRLAEISLVEHHQNWRSQSAAGRAWRRLPDRGQFTALHGWHEERAPRPAQNRPNRSKIWNVLVALRHHLSEEMIPPRQQKLVELTDKVYPPLFLFDSRTGRAREHLLSEALSEFLDPPLEPPLPKESRREQRLIAAEKHHARLVAEMQRTSPPS